MDTSIHPVTPDRLSDLLELFGSNGAYSNCWCTWFLLSNADFDAATATERRSLLLGLVNDGAEPGLLAYREGEPVGWCAVGPRSRYARMMSSRSRVYRPLDDHAAQWVVNCFYVAAEHRGSGIATELLAASTRFAFERGATRLEAYPIDSGETRRSSAQLFTGTLGMFLEAGYVQIGRPNGRPLVRLERARLPGGD